MTFSLMYSEERLNYIQKKCMVHFVSLGMGFVPDLHGVYNYVNASMFSRDLKCWGLE